MGGFFLAFNAVTRRKPYIYFLLGVMGMTEEQKAVWVKLAVAAGIIYAAYRFAPNQAIKVMALGVGGIVIAKQVPYVKEVV